MSLKTLEREILFELNRLVIFKRRLKWSDVLEWNTSEEKVKSNLQEGDTAVFASLCWVAVKRDLLKGKWKVTKLVVSTANMSALLINEDTKGERYLAIAPGLTHEQAVEFVNQYRGTRERIAGFYTFG